MKLGVCPIKKYDIGAIIYPAYGIGDKRTAIFWPDGEGEWETVKKMVKKEYDGSRWPRKPLWGYVNEADKYVMEMQIKAALEHHVNVFIYDWYWYDNRPYLEDCLNEGFLKADNNKEMQFYLMWANHDANYLWDMRNSDNDLSTVIWQGTVSEAVFDTICDRVIEQYFKTDNYYKIDGCPVFMIFHLSNLIKSFGSVENTKAALEKFRQKTKDAGFKELHLQLSFFGDGKIGELSGNDRFKDSSAHKIMAFLDFDSFTNYNWACSVDIDKDFCEVLEAMKNQSGIYSEWVVPYCPNVTVGWDNNVRFHHFIPGVMKNNTPENFEKSLLWAKSYLNDHPNVPPLITINSWNEWTETSYLEPDDLYGYGYLEAIKKVFEND